MKPITALSFLCAAALASSARAQIYDTNNEVVQTFAGYGIADYVDGQGLFTAFSSPSQVVADSAGNLYLWDSGNARLRKITPGGTVSTFVGGGAYLEGYGTNVSLSWSPAGTLAIDQADKLWLVMGANYSAYPYLLSITTNAYVAFENGGQTNLTSASGLCFDAANNLYYSGGNRIYRYNPANQTAKPFAGNGVAGNLDGQGTVFTAFNQPTALACDQADNIYVWDSNNGLIRRVDQNQNVATIAGNGSYYNAADGSGTNASFSTGYGNGVASMSADTAGNLYLVCGSSIRKIDAQTNVVTLAGAFNSTGFANGPGSQARFNGASGGCFSQGSVFVADSANNRIRQITFNPAPQIVPPANLRIQTYAGLQINGTVGRTYRIQTSPDLNTWATVTTLLLTSSPYLWVDTTPAGGNKYYRAVMLP